MMAFKIISKCGFTYKFIYPIFKNSDLCTYVVFETCGTSFRKIKLFWVCGSQSCFEFVWMFVYVTVSALHSTKNLEKIAILRCHNAVSLVSRNKSLS